MTRKRKYKPTLDEQNERLDVVIRGLGRGLRKSQVKRLLKQHIENKNKERQVLGITRLAPIPCGRTLEEYVARARKEIERDEQRPKPELAAEMVNICMGVLEDPASTKVAILRAVREICRIRGLYSPIEHRHAGSDASDTPIKIEGESLEVHREALRREMARLEKVVGNGRANGEQKKGAKR